MLSKPAVSAALPISASVGLVPAGVPGQSNRMICSPIFMIRSLRPLIAMCGNDEFYAIGRDIEWVFARISSWLQS